MSRYAHGFFGVFFLIASAIPLVSFASSCNRPERGNERSFPIAKNLPNTVRMVTYNIRGESALDCQHGNAWESRKNKISYLLKRYQPDLIGLQGVRTRYMTDIQTLFSEYICIAFDVNENNKDVVLLVHASRFSIENNRYFWLSEDPFSTSIPEQPAWGGQSPRIVISVTLRDHYNSNNRLVVMCTHFDSAGMESRIKSAEVLMKQVAHIDASVPLVIAGDFNFILTTPTISEKSQQAYALITDAGLYDIRDSSSDNHYGPDGTWIGWPYDKYAAPHGAIGERLDTIFVRHCVVMQEGVLNLKVNSSMNDCIESSHGDFIENGYPSDHLPVIADLLLL
jgi:endonuclease/exonuclease/phosphatase family metal-dependent hydrolase